MKRKIENKYVSKGPHRKFHKNYLILVSARTAKHAKGIFIRKKIGHRHYHLLFYNINVYNMYGKVSEL